MPVAGDGREAAAAVLVRLSTVWWMTIKQHKGGCMDLYTSVVRPVATWSNGLSTPQTQRSSRWLHPYLAEAGPSNMMSAN